MIEAVFDTNILLQAASSKDGPSAACWRFAEERKIRVFLTEQILVELEDVLNRPKVRKQFPRLTDSHVSHMLAAYRAYSSLVVEPPASFQLDRDKDDAKFVDLASWTGATFIISRDNDLLDLSKDLDFVSRFPAFSIVTPVGFLEIVRAT